MASLLGRATVTIEERLRDSFVPASGPGDRLVERAQPHAIYANTAVDRISQFASCDVYAFGNKSSETFSASPVKHIEIDDLLWNVA